MGHFLTNWEMEGDGERAQSPGVEEREEEERDESRPQSRTLPPLSGLPVLPVGVNRHISNLNGSLHCKLHTGHFHWGDN